MDDKLEEIKAALQVYPWSWRGVAAKGSQEMRDLRSLMRRAGRELGLHVRTGESRYPRESDGLHVAYVAPADIDERRLPLR